MAKTKEPKELKELRKKRPRGPWRNFDVLVGLALMALPFIFYSRYWRFNIPVAAFGLVFLTVQKILNRGERDPIPIEVLAQAQMSEDNKLDIPEPEEVKRRKRVSLGVRCFGALVLVLYCAVIFGFGSGIRGMYKLRKSLYLLGNYSLKSEILDFAPETIVKPAGDLEMTFISPGQGLYTYGHVEISFITDEAGVAELRQTAIDRGGELCEEDSFVYKKLKVFCEARDWDYEDMEVYLCGEITENCPAYMVNPGTGACAVYW